MVLDMAAFGKPVRQLPSGRTHNRSSIGKIALPYSGPLFILGLAAPGSPAVRLNCAGGWKADVSNTAAPLLRRADRQVSDLADAVYNTARSVIDLKVVRIAPDQPDYRPDAEFLARHLSLIKRQNIQRLATAPTPQLHDFVESVHSRSGRVITGGAGEPLTVRRRRPFGFGNLRGGATRDGVRAEYYQS